MKTLIHPNSLAAYEKIDLTNNQRIVLAAFRRGEGTDQQIADRLKWGINRVTGRIHELLEFEKLEICGEATSEFGNKVRVSRIKIQGSSRNSTEPFGGQVRRLGNHKIRA